MGKNTLYRKPRPSVPLWVFFDLDGCWLCKNRNNCNNCKIMKEYNAEFRARRKRKDKNLFKKLIKQKQYDEI